MLMYLPLFILQINNAISDLNLLNRNCSHDDHCGDFRLICSSETNSCVCARYYVWEPSLQQCNLNLTELQEWLRTLEDERDHRGELDEEALSIFYHLGLSGILAISLGLLGGFICVFLFCFLKVNKHQCWTSTH